MPLFHFRPISENLNHSKWRASTEKKSCYIWADNKEEAIRFIEDATKLAVSKSPGEKISISPWRDPELVLINDVANIAGEAQPLGTFWFE